jgi:predicted amidophosphoribosyltransferase
MLESFAHAPIPLLALGSSATIVALTIALSWRLSVCGKGARCAGCWRMMPLRAAVCPRCGKTRVRNQIQSLGKAPTDAS